MVGRTVAVRSGCLVECLLGVVAGVARLLLCEVSADAGGRDAAGELAEEHKTVLDEGNGVPVDADGDPLQLAMLGINPITAYCLLHGYVKLAPGAWVAQTGASSATVGYVVALAKHAGLRTPNVVRRADSVRPLLDAGADVVLVEGGDLTDQAAEAIGDAPLELIIDAVAGEPVAKLASLLRAGGPIVSYTARNRQPLSIPIVDLIFRGLSVHGYWLNRWPGALDFAGFLGLRNLRGRGGRSNAALCRRGCDRRCQTTLRMASHGGSLSKS